MRITTQPPTKREKQTNLLDHEPYNSQTRENTITVVLLVWATFRWTTSTPQNSKKIQQNQPCTNSRLIFSFWSTEALLYTSSSNYSSRRHHSRLSFPYLPLTHVYKLFPKSANLQKILSSCASFNGATHVPSSSTRVLKNYKDAHKPSQLAVENLHELLVLFTNRPFMRGRLSALSLRTS